MEPDIPSHPSPTPTTNTYKGNPPPAIVAETTPAVDESLSDTSEPEPPVPTVVEAIASTNSREEAPMKSSKKHGHSTHKTDKVKQRKAPAEESMGKDTGGGEGEREVDADVEGGEGRGEEEEEDEEGPEKIPATIEFFFPGASEVFVAGDFSGGWSKKPLLMRASQSVPGLFWLQKGVPPGTYRYRFVVGGEVYIHPYKPRVRLPKLGVVNTVTYASRKILDPSVTVEYALLNGVRLQATSGDITDESVDCIVNAANGLLRHGSGIARAVRKKGGRQVLLEGEMIIRKYGEIKVGRAVMTSGGDLKAKYVAHAVGPRWGGDKFWERGDKHPEKSLQRCVVESLTLAVEKGCTSIAIPSISSGVFGGDKQVCAHLIVDAVIRFVTMRTTTSTLKLIKFSAFDQITTRSFCDQLIDQFQTTYIPV